MSRAYPVPEKRWWMVQVEFLDGTIIDGASDFDVIDRWRRLASWTDPNATEFPEQWLNRVFDRARQFYGAALIGIGAKSEPEHILDALAAEDCVILRRRT